MKHLPPVGEIKGALLEAAPTEEGCRILLQYVDREGEWQQVEMLLSDALFLHALVSQTMEAAKQVASQEAVQKRVRSAYPEIEQFFR